MINAQPKQKRRWFTTIALSAAAFVDSAEDYSLSILWASMYQPLGMRVGQLGTILGISGLIRTLTLPFWGWAADRFSRKAILVGITGIWGLWTLAVGFVHNFEQIMAVRIISSLGLAVLWPTAFSLLSDLFDSKERGRAAGVMTAISFTGDLASYAILPALAALNPEGWRIGFIAMGIASSLTGLLMLGINDPPRGSTEPEISDVARESEERFTIRLADLPHLGKIRTWWVLLFQNSIDAVGMSVLYGWAYTWLDSLGLGQSAFMVVILLTLGTLLGQLFFGWLGDKLDIRYPQRGRSMMALIGFIITCPALWAFIALGPRSVGMLMIFGALSGLGIASVDTGARWPISQSVMPPELRSSGRATLDMVRGIIGTLAVTFTTYLVDHYGLTTMLLLMIPIPKLIGAVLWVPVLWTYPYDRQRLHTLLEERRHLLNSETGSGKAE